MPIYKSKVDLKSNDLPERLKNPYYHDTDDVRENVAHQNGFYLAVNELTEIDQTPRDKPDPKISRYWFWFIKVDDKWILRGCKAVGDCELAFAKSGISISGEYCMMPLEDLLDEYPDSLFVPAIVPEIEKE